eukprot:5564390-Prymnesium_polylepis.1
MPLPSESSASKTMSISESCGGRDGATHAQLRGPHGRWGCCCCGGGDVDGGWADCDTRECELARLPTAQRRGLGLGLGSGQ